MPRSPIGRPAVELLREDLADLEGGVGEGHSPGEEGGSAEHGAKLKRQSLAGPRSPLPELARPASPSPVP
jgi:hypothetical protein